MMNQQRGFTMVELIVTMVIIGIMAIAVLPRMDLLSGFDEIGFRDQVKATLEYARKSAVAGRRHVCVARSGNDLILTRNPADPDGLAAVCPDNAVIANQLALPSGSARDCPPGTPANQICAPSGVTLGGPAAVIFLPLGTLAGGADGAYPISVGGTTTATISVVAATGYVFH